MRLQMNKKKKPLLFFIEGYINNLRNNIMFYINVSEADNKKDADYCKNDLNGKHNEMQGCYLFSLLSLHEINKNVNASLDAVKTSAYFKFRR